MVHAASSKTAILEFQPMWTCRICTSPGLLERDHTYCPNCGHERDIEAVVFPEWDAVVRASEHRFLGVAHVCCERGWSLNARWCGGCGDPLGQEARPEWVDRSIGRLRVQGALRDRNLPELF